jgi:hypothetical protein
MGEKAVSMVFGAPQSGQLDDLIKAYLRPYVKKIDAEAYYAKDYLLALGRNGWLSGVHKSQVELQLGGARLVEETARTCMTTAFNLWCHLASMTYLRMTDNGYLREEVLPLLEGGHCLGATGLSNPMKYYSGLEKLHLKATRTDGGYLITGQLGAVSNLCEDHWFGIIAQAEDDQRIMAFVPCNADGLELIPKAEFLGLNGSATYSCRFDGVFIPDRMIIASDADRFVPRIRPYFVLYQVPLALGVIGESIRGIEYARNRQFGCNAYLRVQADELEQEFRELRERFYQLAGSPDLADRVKELLRVRLDAAYLALKAVQTCMLHQGGAAYLRYSDASRRLREAYFFANLTPTVKHLEKLLST